MQMFWTGIAQLPRTPVSDSPNCSALRSWCERRPNAAQKVYPVGGLRLLWGPRQGGEGEAAVHLQDSLRPTLRTKPSNLTCMTVRPPCAFINPDPYDCSSWQWLWPIRRQDNESAMVRYSPLRRIPTAAYEVNSPSSCKLARRP